MINKDFIEFVKSEVLYNTNEFIPLHPPVFRGNEKNISTTVLMLLLYRVWGNM